MTEAHAADAAQPDKHRDRPSQWIGDQHRTRREQPTRPKAMVVFESMFGDTEDVAHAVATGLRTWADVTVTRVSDAPTELASDLGLLVVGGPTHAFSMSRATTRADAVRRGAAPPNATTGVREWLDALPHGLHSTVVATFDTKVRSMRHMPGSAARAAASTADRHGFDLAATPASFFVENVEGPLSDGELTRATAWATELASELHVSP
ncbi:MAG: hypothetical protein QOE37_1086 [Microbacteriaceae bacterium]|nr:hypothetical protein [Microbacteriaceae bacterium]